MKRGFTVRLLSYTALGFSWVYLINCVSAVFSSSSGDWMGDLRSPDPASHPIVLTRLFSGYVRRLAVRATTAGNLPSLLGQELFLKAIQAWKIDHSVICQLPCLWDKNLFTWFWWSAVEWHCGAMGFTSSCCYHFIPCCIQIQFSVSQCLHRLPFIQESCALGFRKIALLFLSLLWYEDKIHSPRCRKTLAWGRAGHRSCCPLEGSLEDNLLWKRQQHQIEYILIRSHEHNRFLSTFKT